jgi:hypothetical protein
MFVLVTGAGVRLEEPEDTKRFHVAVGEGVVDVDGALKASGLGSLADGGADAYIDIAAVRRAAAGRVDAGWEEAFAGMLAYAGSKGWLTPDGASIQAHVEAASTT